MADVARWLNDLGLGQYAQAFAENDIDLDVLPDLSEQDLGELGISLGHRKKLLRAIGALSAASEPMASNALTVDGAEPSPDRRTEATRRQLTVMLVNLIGSTGVDPEDTREVIRSYQEACTEVVKRWDGHIAKFMGDGVLAYFGWPRAHEDDAERAVRAALDLTERIARPTGSNGTPLAVRVGIATGLVMVGDLAGEGAAQEEAVVGETPNLAARLHGLAGAGAVVIAQSTRQLLGDLFHFDDMGVHELKGIAPPVQVWRVVAESRVESRFEALHGARLTPLVGREEELSLLLARWQRAKDGDGQVVLLSGEPGIGKSRIVRALRERLAGEPCTPVSVYGSPHHVNSALHPIIDLLERAAAFERGDIAETKLDKLERLLAQSTSNLDQVVPLVAGLLSIPVGTRCPQLNLSPQRQKQRTLAVLVDQLEGLAAKQPVLELYEDVHWVDPSTLELLDLVIERVKRLPVLVVITYRPEFSPPWTGYPYVMQLSLPRLTRRHSEAMIARLARGKMLPAEIIDQIVAHTDGVPLFIEELTKATLESGMVEDVDHSYELSRPFPRLAIPPPLHDSLMARLDRLGSARGIAQIGAAIGREFPEELLTAVAPVDSTDLQEALDQLIRSQLVVRRVTRLATTYSFKHALIHEVAYDSMLRSKRRQLHARIAEVMERRFQLSLVVEPEIAAQHWMQAGEAGKAAHYWQKAGERAIERSANLEAIGHLERGLKLLDTLPESAEVKRRELDLLTRLGPAVLAAKGFGAPEAEAVYHRAQLLCTQVDEPECLFLVLHGLARIYHIRPELPRALAIGRELLALADRIQSPAHHVQAHRVLGTNLWVLGEFTAARDHTERGLALYDPGRDCWRARQFGGDPGVMCAAILARVLWMLGCPDQALVKCNEAIGLAKAAPDPFGLALSLGYASHLRLLRGELPAAQDLAEATIALSAEQIFPQWESFGAIMWGGIMLERGDGQAGLVQIRQGMAARQAAMGKGSATSFLALAARAQSMIGHADAGFATLTEALELVDRTGERFWEAELHRLRGELLRKSKARDEVAAEAALLKAVEVARSQAARSWQLRAATSLARFWCDQGKRQEARDLLAPVYDWFTEGFDTADLKDAKALLDELS